MCQNVPPLELFDDDLYNMLRPTWQNAVARVCVRLHKYGDGQITEEWLQKRILPRKRWEEFRTLMLAWGWLKEAPETRNLMRAGILAPGRGTEAEQNQSIVSADALRMQIRRAIGAEFEKLRCDLGLQVRTDPQYPANENGTYAEQAAVASAEAGEQNGSPRLNGRPPDNSNVINSNPSHICEINSNSNGINPDRSGAAARTPAEHAENRYLRLALPEEPQSNDVARVLMTAGFTESEVGKILKSYPISSILDGIQCLADGGWPDSKNDRTTLQSYFRGKLGLNKRWKANRDQVASGQVSAMMSVSGGPSPPADPAQAARAPAAAPDPPPAAASFIDAIGMPSLRDQLRRPVAAGGARAQSTG